MLSVGNCLHFLEMRHNEGKLVSGQVNRTIKNVFFQTSSQQHPRKKGNVKAAILECSNMLPERVPLVLLHALGHVASEVRCSDLPPVAEADHVLPPPDHHLGRKTHYLIVHGQYHILP